MFGSSIRVLGDRIFIGDPAVQHYHDDADGNRVQSKGKGSVWIFDLLTGNLIHHLPNPTPTITSSNSTTRAFGGVLEVSENYIAVSNTQPRNYRYKAVDIFDASTFELLGSIESSRGNRTWPGTFGEQIGLSDSYIVISEVFIAGRGSNFVHIYDTATRKYITSVKNPDADAHDSGRDAFGTTVDTSGEYVVVSATAEDIPEKDNVGIVYVFNASNGQLLYNIDAPESTFSAYFGETVQISGKYLVVGTPSSTTSSIHIFDITDGSLLHSVPVPVTWTSDAQSNVGRSVSMSGGKLTSMGYGNPRSDMFVWTAPSI